MSKRPLFVRPKNPASPEAEAQALEALVQWGMACKADFDRKQAEKKNAQKAEERGSSPPSSAAPMAVRSK